MATRRPPPLPFATPKPNTRKGAAAQKATRTSLTVNNPKENPFSVGAVNSPRAVRQRVGRVNIK